MKVGVELFVSTSLSFLPIAILGMGLVLDGLGRDRLTAKLVCSGFSSFRCSLETEICLAIDSSTGFMLEVFSSISSTSCDAWLRFECADVAGEDGEGFRSLATDVDAVEGVCCGGVIICHLGSCVYETRRTDSDLTISNSGDDTSVGDSSIKFDESGLNW